MSQSEEVMGVVLYQDAIFHHLNKTECHRLNVDGSSERMLQFGRKVGPQVVNEGWADRQMLTLLRDWSNDELKAE